MIALLLAATLVAVLGKEGRRVLLTDAADDPKTCLGETLRESRTRTFEACAELSYAEQLADCEARLSNQAIVVLREGEGPYIYVSQDIDNSFDHLDASVREVLHYSIDATHDLEFTTQITVGPEEMTVTVYDDNTLSGVLRHAMQENRTLILSAFINSAMPTSTPTTVPTFGPTREGPVMVGSEVSIFSVAYHDVGYTTTSYTDEAEGMADQPWRRWPDSNQEITIVEYNGQKAIRIENNKCMYGPNADRLPRGRAGRAYEMWISLDIGATAWYYWSIGGSGNGGGTISMHTKNNGLRMWGHCLDGDCYAPQGNGIWNGQWLHIVHNFPENMDGHNGAGDGEAGRFDTFWNGQHSRSEAWAICGGWNGEMNTSTQNPLYIGGHSGQGCQNWSSYNYYVNSFVVHDRELTRAEVAEKYEAGPH